MALGSGEDCVNIAHPAGFVVSTAVFSGIVAGIGGIIGYVVDDYMNVWVNNHLGYSALKRFDFGFGTSHTTKYNITLTCKLTN